MKINFRSLHPIFAAEVSDLDLTEQEDGTLLEQIRTGMDEYAVLVFRKQRLDDSALLEFARKLGGELHAKTGIAAIAKSRFGMEALTDVSNVAADGSILPEESRKRQYGLANRLWHTDASFENPPGRFSLLIARVLPSDGPDTQFVDTRAAYDTLNDDMQCMLESLTAHHSIAYSRQRLGFVFSEGEQKKLEGAEQPLVRINPKNRRKSLYIAAHCSHIIGWSVPDGRILLQELIEHATKSESIYSHRWEEGDLVIYDNSCTMHRAMPFGDTLTRRELRRVTTLDR